MDWLVGFMASHIILGYFKPIRKIERFIFIYIINVFRSQCINIILIVISNRCIWRVNQNRVNLGVMAMKVHSTLSSRKEQEPHHLQFSVILRTLLKKDIDICYSYFCWEILEACLLDFNGISTCLGLFYAQILRNCVHCTLIFKFFDVGFFLAHGPFKCEYFLVRSIWPVDGNIITSTLG